jgi:hypothetical protein
MPATEEEMEVVITVEMEVVTLGVMAADLTMVVVVILVEETKRCPSLLYT